MASTIDLIEQVRAQLAPLASGDAAGDMDFAITQAIAPALRTLAASVADNKEPAIKDYFQTTFTCTLTGTTAPFSAHLISAEPLIITLPFPEVRHASVTYPFLYVGDRTLLGFSESPDFGYYTVVDTDILIKAPTGVSVAGTLTVLSNFVPTLASVPAQVLPYLVKIIIGMLTHLQ